jgi:Uma2 family endonuclease
MKSSAKKNKTSYEKWLELPSHFVGEIIMNDLHVSPRPSPIHARASTKLSSQLDGPFDSGKNGPGGWIILFEPEIHIESDIFVPDIAGWRRERLPQVPHEAYFTLICDWACEVLSPSTAILDRTRKMPLYAQYGLKHFWLVDPSTQTLEVYENDRSKWRLLDTFAENDKIKAPPFEVIEIDLSLLWS